MITGQNVRQLALSFPEMVKLSPVDQSVFCAIDRAMIYPVPGGWGKKGATYLELKKVTKPVFRDALTTAYCHVAPGKLAGKFLR
jgi:hypothetical protein